jgi:hypothetical protein
VIIDKNCAAPHLVVTNTNALGKRDSCKRTDTLKITFVVRKNKKWTMTRVLNE